ncbi:MAG TPA: ATP-binding protein [Actinomycetota bacterium]|nr:ATP-binding protein [Actinomycetota bacterium]
MSADVTVTVPAAPEFVRVVRFVAASVGAAMDLTYDRIEDLRLAVDEACDQLLALPGDDAMLTVRVTPTGTGVRVFACTDAPASPGTWPPTGFQEGLAWRVLTGLADDVAFELTDEGASVRMAVEGGGT